MNKIYIGNNKWFIDDGLVRSKNGNIDWISNVGKTIEFKCLDYYGCYTIKEVIKTDNKFRKYLYIIYFDNDTQNEHIVNYQNLAKVNFSYILGLYSNDFLYDVGDIVNGQFLILKREHKKLFPSDKSCIKTYTCKCLNDGYIFENSEKNLRTQKKCEVCLGKVVIRGINDMATTRPQLIRFLKNKNDAYEHTGWSCKTLNFACDICGRDFYCAPNGFGFNFPCGCYSSDSYPNRLIQEVFNQLKISYIRELRKCHFSWCGKYKYDLYFECNDASYIIEMDGGLHKGDRLKIDTIKDELASKNGVKVIRIDCDYDKTEYRLQYIKDNILKSELATILDLSNIDWEAIGVKLLERSITKEVCDLRNQGLVTKEIANTLNVSISVVDSHLKIGKNNGLLNKWAMSSHCVKTKVFEITNLESGEIQYCVGTRNFYKNTEPYIGIKVSHHIIDRHETNGRTIFNGYEIKKISYYDYLVKTTCI